MKLLLEESKATDKERLLQYLPAWLSVVGQAVGLKIARASFELIVFFNFLSVIGQAVGLKILNEPHCNL